ncbi:coiled-coil domain-containing protein 18 isoform X19 [Pangasianodon hypophthalmus]|uniref:coiled-coil domain-containing protein 18 isoform X19 n=1 Tax=Pangasianodon hypophthalmus TaxID=310915 RepID=UPI00230756CD|nr:coiled-coil domain-containing protein 18 isoform X19 [Pangasianodon hypophthalmus]
MSDQGHLGQISLYLYCSLAGVRTELSNCNERLLEKTEYSFNIEKDMFALKEQLREIRILCINASQASAIQIAALQNQLDHMLKQLGEKDTGPAADVLNILQKYVEVQKLELNLLAETDPSKIAELQKQLKKSRADLEEVNENLDKLECQAVNNSQILHVVSLQQQIDELRNTGGSNSSSQILVLETQLEKAMRHLEENEDTASILIKPIIRLQDEIVELYERQALLLITHIQFTAFQSRLGEKEILLSDLQKEKEEKGDDRNINEQIDAVEQEVRQLEARMDDLKKNLSQKLELEKELQEKKTQLEDKLKQMKNDSQELISQILTLQLELRVRQIEAQGEKMAAQTQITDLEKELSEKSERITELLGRNQYLEEKIADTLAECNDNQENYNELLNKVEKLTAKVDDSNLRQILDIVSLNQEINNLEDRIRSKMSESKRNELQKELREKKEQLDSKKKELETNDDLNTRITLRIISELDELRKLQNENVGVDQIKDKKDELLGLLSELDDSNLAKIMLKNLFLLSDMSQLKKFISHLKQQTDKQMAELQEEVRKKEKQLRRKTTELGQKDSDVPTLTKEIRDLEEELKNLTKQTKDLGNTSASQLRELEEQLNETRQKLEKGNKALQEKDAEFAKNELEEQLNKKEEELSDLNNNNAELEEQLKKKEEELSHLINNTAELEEQLKKKEEELSHLNNNTTDVIDDNKCLQDDVTRLNERVKELEKLEEQLNKKEEELSDLNNNNAELEEQLNKKEEELSDLNNNNADVIDENERLRDLVTTLHERVKELEMMENKQRFPDEDLFVKKNEQPVTEEPSKDISVASLEFDLQTAHRRLLISTDGKTARGAEYASAVRDSPKRYDTVIAALTKTGFTSGRHYWEVLVKDRSCFVVGVAAESAPRKGEIRYKPSNGYWTILRKKDRRHQAQTERPFTLRFTDKLSIIGILVDFTKGEVTFYNVQTRASLYKFRGNNFTEKLYPYVATCTDENPQESPIELLQPHSPLWLQ